MHNQGMFHHPSHQSEHILYEEYYPQEIDPPQLHPQYHHQPQQARYVSMMHPLHISPPPQPILPQPHHYSQPQIQAQHVPSQQRRSSNVSENINLNCDEEVGRKSPEAFPEYVPGAWDEVRKHRVRLYLILESRFETLFFSRLLQQKLQ